MTSQSILPSSPQETSSDLVTELADWLRERELMTKVIKFHLTRACDRMKKQADKHRSERSFEVGESVYPKLQPYVQSSVATRSNNKLTFRFFGPCKILERVGALEQLFISCNYHLTVQFTRYSMSHNLSELWVVINCWYLNYHKEMYPFRSLLKFFSIEPLNEVKNPLNK